MDKFVELDEKLMNLLVKQEDFLTDAVRRSQAAGLPAIEVSPAQGQFLYLLAKLSGARRILEIGTLAGYSTLFFAKSLPDEGGTVVTLESDPDTASVAEENFMASPYRNKIQLLVGQAKNTMRLL
ncbi:O-methyltransferase family protein [Listeria floridensis FSL S10-1187]|uniref:O-methyltransferase family protein n=1 Tax=Listeria floridensis FSL S10-1187 TaxID=1265817 RepID=A0ABP3AYB8_9LIST|nr:O-methyltransferase family protein [Listeria floridensis FSL S10-1187]